MLRLPILTGFVPGERVQVHVSRRWPSGHYEAVFVDVVGADAAGHVAASVPQMNEGDEYLLSATSLATPATLP